MNKPRVLFLCTGNSCRSQMAEGFLRYLAGDRFEALSAGTQPIELNPNTVQVMKEVDIDISCQRSKHAREYLGQSIPFVITVCDKAKESCPIFPGTHKALHWSLEDPAEAKGTREQRLAVFRRVRDEIHHHMEEFLASVD